VSPRRTLLAAGIAASTGSLSCAPATAAVHRCTTSDLAASLVSAGVGLGNANAHVYLQNTSTHTCVLRGYAGFGLQTAEHRVQPSHVMRGSTYFQHDPGAREVVLRPGARAVTDLAWTDTPSAGEPSQGACELVSASLEVTPPGQRHYLLIPFGASVCDHGRMRTTALTPVPAPNRQRSDR